ncbi:MAG: tetratricopeptide repeat protein [Promethearchaeota archaeon]
MPRSKPQELVRVEQLIEIAKFDEADQLIKKFEEKEGNSLYDLILCNLFKCKSLFGRGLHEDVVKLAEQTHKESLRLGRNILSVDILLIMAEALLNLDQTTLSEFADLLDLSRTEKSHKLIQQGDELLKNLKLKIPAESKLRKAYIAWLKGWVYTRKEDYEQAIKQHKQSLSLREELGNKVEIVRSLNKIAYIYMIPKMRNLELSSKYLERSLTIAEESGHKGVLGITLSYIGGLYRIKGDCDRRIMVSERALALFQDINNIFKEAGAIYALGECFLIKGEIDRSQRFFEQSLELSKKIDYKWEVANTLNALAYCYQLKGELDRALECIEQAMVLNREMGEIYFLANNHDFLIQILIDMDDLERASNVLQDLEQLNNQLKLDRINFTYLIDKALLLKTYPRARDRGLAEEILKNLLKEESLVYEDRFDVLINLCELLLTDLKLTNEVEILEEIKLFIQQLLFLSENSHSFLILGETYLLQAKLALINFDVKEARQLLTQAQKIAESHGIKRLAMKISYEHDELLGQTKMWENLKTSEVPLSERLELTGINDQMEHMVKKRMIEVPDLSDEEPVLLLIVSEGGTPFFSQSFMKNKAFESHLFGGFLTTIDYFIKEMFSEGLDRAVFGEYTLLMKSVPPFFIIYIFRGNSYYALQKLNYFENQIQKEEEIWQDLLNSFQRNKTIQLNDIPLLDSLITKAFLMKNLVVN